MRDVILWIAMGYALCTLLVAVVDAVRVGAWGW